MLTPGAKDQLGKTMSSVIKMSKFIFYNISRFFGITSPKYYREIQEFKKMQIEEAERKKEEAENTSGWTNIGNSPSEVITELDASKLTASNPSKAIYQIDTTTTTCDTTDETNLESRP